MKIYIDSQCKCHVNDKGTMRELEQAFFDGKCAEFIEGYRCVPAGETWTRADGEVFRGEMIAPWKAYSELEKAQLEYELALAKAERQDMLAALEKLGVDEDA